MAMTGASSCLLIAAAAACLTGCLVVGDDREYDPAPPALPPPQLLSGGTRLSRALADDRRMRPVLKKRLGAGGDGRCSADQRRNSTIIKTKDSLDAGAQFITAPSVTNYRDCEDECCREKNCNTAVVNLKESKNGQFEGIACYLFDCRSPSVCIFTSHLGFIVLEFDSKKYVDQHTDELDRLVSSSGNSSVAATTTSTTTSSTTATVVEAEPKENGARKSFASLFSECHGSSDCRAQNTDCLSGYCVCQQGFHVMEMQCRKDCDQELEFECANKNSPLFSECIAVYDYCDGIAQCTDGSDETSCGQRKEGLDLSAPQSEGTEARFQSELKELSHARAEGHGRAGEGEGQAKIAYIDPSFASPLKSQNNQEEIGGIKVPQDDRTGSSEVEDIQRLVSPDSGKDASDEYLPRSNSDSRKNAPGHESFVDASHSSSLQQQNRLTQEKQPMDRQRNKANGDDRLKDPEDFAQQRIDRPVHGGSSYTDQLLSYGTISSDSKKYADGGSHAQYHEKSSAKDESFVGGTRGGFQSTGDGRSRGETPVHVAEEDQLPDERTVSQRGEQKHQLNGQEKLVVPASGKNKHLFGGKDETDSNSYPAWNYAEVGGGQNGPDESRLDEGSRIMSEDPSHYSRGHYDEQKTGLERLRGNRFHRPIDQSVLDTSYMDVGQVRSNGEGEGRVLANKDQAIDRLPSASMMSRQPLAGGATGDDAHRHKTPVDYTQQELGNSKTHQRGYYNAGEHMVHGTVSQHLGYEQQPGSKSVNALPDHRGGYDRSGSMSGDLLTEHKGFDRGRMKPADLLPGRSRYDQMGPKLSAGVHLEKSEFEKQWPNVLQDGGRRARPESESLDRPPPPPQHGTYDRVNLKSVDAVPERGEYERQRLKTVDVLPDHNGYEISKLSHSGAKDRLFHTNDHYGVGGRGSVDGTYDSGNYEDEVGNPNYAMWLKAEDQSNDPGGYVDQQPSDSSEGYDHDGYVNRLQSDGAGDLYAPDYMQYYYGNSKPRLVKNARNYVRNGDYDYGTLHRCYHRLRL